MIASSIPAAVAPAEARGTTRDGVRLLVAVPDGLVHARFADLGQFLRPGDLVVVNTSGTLPAAVDGHLDDGRAIVVHFSTELDDGTWTVELRRPDASGPASDERVGTTVALPSGRLTLVRALSPRLWIAQVDVDEPVRTYLEWYGRPITYDYVRGRWPLSAYQTVFAREPGSAEMPSAGRPFTDRLVTDLVTRGVVVAPVLLHTGVSSLEAHEPPQPERFEVPEVTAHLVNDTKRHGGRVVAVGTTVTRAIESVAGPDGSVEPGRGWTDLVLGPDRRAFAVTGLVTGWHDPQASHLSLLKAVAGDRLVQMAYDTASASGYLWHEFGDSCLFLP